jgi:hypothetical protein
VVLMIALIAATALIVLVVATLIGLTVQRQLRGEPVRDHAAPHAGQPQRGWVYLS